MQYSKYISAIIVSLILSSIANASDQGGAIPTGSSLNLNFDNIYGKSQIVCDIISPSAKDEIIYINSCGPACYQYIDSTLNGASIGNVAYGTNFVIKGNNYNNKLMITMRLNPGFGNKTDLSFRKFDDSIINVQNCSVSALPGSYNLK